MKACLLAVKRVDWMAALMVERTVAWSAAKMVALMAWKKDDCLAV